VTFPRTVDYNYNYNTCSGANRCGGMGPLFPYVHCLATGLFTIAALPLHKWLEYQRHAWLNVPSDRTSERGSPRQSDFQKSQFRPPNGARGPAVGKTGPDLRVSLAVARDWPSSPLTRASGSGMLHASGSILGACARGTELNLICVCAAVSCRAVAFCVAGVLPTFAVAVVTFLVVARRRAFHV